MQTPRKNHMIMTTLVRQSRPPPPSVLFTCKITPEVLESWKRHRRFFPENTVLITSGLSSFNGSWVLQEASRDPSGDAAQFLKAAKRVDVKIYGMMADRMMQAALECVRDEHDEPMQRTYSDWPFTKMDRIRALLAEKSQQPLQEAVSQRNIALVTCWNTFLANMHKRIQAYIDVNAAAEAGDHEAARRIFEASQEEFKIRGDDDLNIEGADSPFMLRMCGGNAQFLRHITEQRDFAKPDEGVHHGFRALTKAPYSYLGSAADVAALLWIVTHRSDDPAAFGTVSLPQFAQHAEPVLARLQAPGGLNWLAEQYGGNLPLQWHEDAELDDIRAWAVAERVAARVGKRIIRASYVHPSVLSSPHFSRPTCVGDIIPSFGTSASNQHLGMKEYSECQGCKHACRPHSLSLDGA